MKKLKNLGIVIAFCFSQFFIQCTNDENKRIREKEMTEQETNEIVVLKNFLSAKMGIDLKYIIYDLKIEAFIIDSDMMISLEDANQRFNKANFKITNKTNQMTYHMLMTPEIAAFIKIYVSPEVSSDWRVAINKAVNNWNTINSSINISIVNTSESSNILIYASDRGASGPIAAAWLPNYKGEPGDSININTYFNNLDASKKVNAMTHELGHTFGLEHTDNKTGDLIPCTPVSDLNSVMFSTVHEWKGFTAFDNIAISTLYPVVEGTKKLYRFKKNQYYYYTTNPCEIVPGKDGYVFDKDAGYLYKTQISGTVPLYRILNGNTVKDHRLNKVQTSSNDVILGYLYPTQEVGTVPLYNFGIYEPRPGETPSYVYHILHTTDNSDGILKVVTGYVVSK
jgi:hypothetical protein